MNEGIDNESLKFKCLICGNNNIRKIYSNYPGYVNGTSFDILKCDNCNTQFIIAPSTPNELYDAIYSLDCVPGYDRYKKYAKQIIHERDPLKFLAESEFAYEAVYQYLINKTKNMKILEVGSGLGYLTYALNKAGYKATGIDISEASVKNSIELFGNHYINSNLHEMIKSNDVPYKFDLIIANELIEHLDDPIGFIEECLLLLNENGSILLTTPYYYDIDKIWETDLPPIHRFWFSKKSFEVISERLKLGVSFIFPNPMKGCFHSNLLVSYVLSKLYYNKPPQSILSADLDNCVRSTNLKFKNIINKLVNIEPIRYLSNILYVYLLDPPPKCFAVVLSKK
jgi:SAM-dependent methyltransferase